MLLIFMKKTRGTRETRKNPDNGKVQIIEVRIIEVRL